MTTTNDKLRSLFLSALMVMSVFAGATAFAGTAAANHAEEDVDGQLLNSGDRYWQGQSLFIHAGNADSTTTWELHRDESDGTSFVSEITFNDDGVTTIDTTNRQAGDYVVLDENDNRVVFDSGVDDGTGDAPFSIAVQEFGASATSTNVTNGESGSSTTSTVNFDSNRGSYDVDLSADDLSADDFETIFGSETVTTYEDGTVVAEGVTGSLSADFSGVDAGEYDISFDVNDTSAQDSVAFNVSDAGDSTVTLPSETLAEQRGDVAEFTVNLQNAQEAFVQFGGPSSNFKANFTVVDGDNDGEVTVQVNTYATADADAVRTQDGGFVSAVGDDDSIEVRSATANDEDWTQGVYTGSSADQLVGDDGQALENPIAAGSYDIIAALNNNQRDDKTRISINQRSTDDISTWVYAGSDLPDNGETAELLDGVTERDSVASGDSVVFQVEASGLYGYVDEPADFGGAGNNAGVFLNVSQTNTGPNTGGNSFDASAADGYYFDAENNTFFLAFNTDDNGISAGDEYEADFHVSSANAVTSDDQNVSTEFSVEEQTIEFDNVNDDDVLELENSENATVSGTTNLADGTTVDIDIESPNNLWTATVDVEDGAFNASFDLSELENETELTVSASAVDASTSVDGLVVEDAGGQDDGETETTTEDDDTETTTTEETETTTTTEETTTTTEEDEDTTTTTEEENDGGIPGFGISVALVALLAAALLALRRSN